MQALISIEFMIIVAFICFFYGIARNKEKRIRMLILPLIFTILLYVPGLVFETVPYEAIRDISDNLWQVYVVIIFSGILTWGFLFVHIPLGVYIVMLIVYAVVSWSWILELKKGNKVYALAWIVLCILATLLYWKVGEEYISLMSQ